MSTPFQKANFQSYGGYVTYLDGSNRRFVARFKYQKSGASTFVSFLIKNFTVEEYFGRLEASEAPLTILSSKGYIQPHVRKWLRDAGFPVTQQGYKDYIAKQVAHRANLSHVVNS